MGREMTMLFPETAAFAAGQAERRAALSVRHLTKSFGQEQVLKDVSFTVAEGESLVLLGPSGSGKSTTLRLIAGLEEPEAGEIYLRGRRVDQLRARDRNVGVIFQNYALFPGMTVAENIGFGLRIRGVKAGARGEVVERLLELIGMREQREKLPQQISGGQQQRVAIARALAYEPDVLLFDESFSALDPKTRVGLRREIRILLRKLRVPALFITHDQEEAMDLGDQIAILNQGRLEQVGTPAEVYNEPGTEYVATFLGAANVLEGNWQDGLIRLKNDRYLAGVGNLPTLGVGGRVKIIFRPEDVVLSSVSGLTETPYQLGRGEVMEICFAGALESLRVRLLGYPPTKQRLRTHLKMRVDTGSLSKPEEEDEIIIKVLRTKWDARRLKLRAGDRVTIGLKSYQLLSVNRQHSDSVLTINRKASQEPVVVSSLDEAR
jgi:ABC-type Fe3+/spermidine/putrescine transport system ATPase subunit